MKFNFLKTVCHSAIALFVPLAFACSSSDPSSEPDAPEPPTPGGNHTESVIKPKAMWIDCEANFIRLSTKAGIDAELAKIKKHGFNLIYLDVKPGNGYALYKSDFLPYCNTFGNMNVTRDYDDYLGYFLEKCGELDIDVVGSLVVMGWGLPAERQGYVFDHLDEWENKVQMRCSMEDKSQAVSIFEDVNEPFIMLDPMYPEVQDLVIRTIRELITKYPKLKGVSLDYLRYNNNNAGYYCLGDDNLKGYAEYWNEPLPARTDFITQAGGQGPKYAKWNEFKAMQVTNLMAKIRSAVKAINSDCEIHLWASSHWESRFAVGQNWASKNYKPKDATLYTDTYNRTGFGELLDVFITGAYCTKVWKKDDPFSVWTVENFVTNYSNYLMDACKCYGSIGVYNHNAVDVVDATLLCLKHTDGYMAFELSHTNNGNKWDAITSAFKRYENQ